MTISRSIVAGAIVLALGVWSCSVWKNDSDEDIRAFLSGFESGLKLSDEEILKQFKTQQSREAILSAIHVLQDKESEYIQCTAAFGQFKIIRDAEGVRVNIPVSLGAKDIGDGNLHEQSSFTLWLDEKQDALVITQLDGVDFYEAFSKFRGVVHWQAKRGEMLVERGPIYAKAKEIQQHYDSVILYTQYKGRTFFYVVNGKWVNKFMNNDDGAEAGDYKMGLVDEAGEIVIPVEYELVGTIGFSYPSIVEVRKDGKTGYFDVADQKLVVEPAYDMIMPYGVSDALAIVRADSVYGWVDARYQYHGGFPTPEAQNWVNRFGFFPDDLTIQNGNQSFSEIPREENAGWGIVMPPACFVKTGLFQEMIVGLSTPDVPYGANTEYVNASGTLFEKVTDGLGALFTTIKESYVEGREEFYVNNRLVFVSNTNDTLEVSNVSGESVLAVRRIGDGLIEVKMQEQTYEYMEDSDYVAEFGLPSYTYFALTDGDVRELRSKRFFGFTEFAKLDSSYITGNFYHWNEDINDKEETTSLSLLTLQFLRKEILASYGYKFTDSVDMRLFSRYEQNVESFYDVQTLFSEVDRHNVAFLDKAIGLIETKPM